MADEPLSFMARLKRHHIFRVASVYAIGAWVLLQLANSVFPDLGWPRQSVLILIVAVALLFPVVLVLGWMLIPPSKDNPARYSRWQHLRWRLGSVLTLVIVVLVVISGAFLWRVNTRYARAEAVAKAHAAPTPITTPAPPVATGIPAKSIAVLPFENLSTDKNNAYFADGMQDMILTKLADIGDLKVIARTSTAGYASHPADLKTIAQQLGVATLLEGSVQKSGNRVLINLQLIDANTDNHLWAEAYQRNLNNIFDVEGEVAEKVAAALNARLTQTETTRLSTAPTQNPQAYDLFLRAEYYGNRGIANINILDLEAAIKNYSAAVKQDPKFVLAWARMALIQSLIAWETSPVWGGNQRQMAAQAKRSVAHAMALAPDSVETQLARGWYRLYVLTDLEGALSSFQSALGLKPQNTDALLGLATTDYHLGQFDAAAQAYQKVAVLDPRNLWNLSQLGHTYMELRRYGQAEQVFMRMQAVDPTSVGAMRLLVNVHALTGDLDGAQAVLDAAPASVRADFEFSYTQVVLMLYHHDYDGARRVLLATVPKEHSDHDRLVAEELFGDVEWAAGNQAQARVYYQRVAMLLETALRQHPESWGNFRSDLSWVYARLGRTQEALTQAQRYSKQMIAANSVQREYSGLENMAAVQAQLGQADQAIAGLDRLLAMPAGEQVSVPLLKLDPTWDPIRNDPRFQALLRKYSKNTQTMTAGT